MEDLKEIGLESLDWFQVTQDKIPFHAFCEDDN
jgi:hypothetical protein